MNEELPDALRGIICMIENQQYSLAIECLNKRIIELESE